jgi:hypothetical protein
MDGRWTCVESVAVEHPKGRLQFNRGAVFGPGDTLMGIKVAAWLDSLVETRRAATSEDHS